MHRPNILSLFLLAVITTSALASCGGDTPAATPTQVVSSTATSAGAEPTLGETRLTEAGALYNEGREKQLAGDLNGAFADYSRAIEIDPKLALAYLNRGVIYILQGDVDKAIEDHNKAIELGLPDADLSQAYTNRGSAYLAKGEQEQALGDYNKAVETDSQNAKAYLGRGLYFAEKGDIENASLDLAKVVELSPNTTEAGEAQKALEELGVSLP